MGVIDKLKNALFEVEYVEVEEPPKKEKTEKVSVFEKVKAKTEARDKKEAKKEKPIAKKIVLPGKKEEKIEELEEEELKDEDFEIRPKDETIKEESDNNFKFMEDEDFEMDYEYVPGEAEILNTITPEEETDSYTSEIEERKEEIKDFYREEKKERENKPYGLDNSYKVPMHEYGTYERYEEKTYFKPSPIISPIYGILDKNYKKEDVKEKTEVRLSSYTRGNVSVDDIRNKAYGSTKDEKKEVEEDIKFEVEDEEDNLTVDLNEEAKPEVKEITVGDAVEYFQDLGLEYNVDYVDASVDKKDNKKKKEEPKEEEEVSEDLEEIVEEDSPVVEEESAEEKVIEIPEVEDEDSNDEEDDDNLFDLIDSMYEEDNKEGE